MCSQFMLKTNFRHFEQRLINKVVIVGVIDFEEGYNKIQFPAAIAPAAGNNVDKIGPQWSPQIKINPEKKKKKNEMF